tara:strand:+ start:388 stop:621 length:234 start_codon:yes stop_codon:yes gene_type:complete
MQETFENSLFNVRRMSIDRGCRGMSYLKVFCVVRGRGGIKGRLSIPYPFVYSLLMGNGGRETHTKPSSVYASGMRET